MTPRKSYATATVIKSDRIVPGVYIGKILGAEDVTGTSKKGKSYEYLKISVDVTEGEYKDYYADDYRNQTGDKKWWKGSISVFVPNDDGSEEDGKTANKFKTTMSKIEESNKGYTWNWDEKTLKNKTVGFAVRRREYESGKFATEVSAILSVDEVRKGTYWKGYLEDRLLKGGSSSSNSEPKADADGFVNLAAGIASELPFN